MQVGGVAGDRQRPEHLRVRGIGDVDRVQRVDLLERDDVAVAADEAYSVDALALSEPAELADLVELAAARAERRQERLAVAGPVAPPGGRVGRDDAEHTLEVGERPLRE